MTAKKSPPPARAAAGILRGGRAPLAAGAILAVATVAVYIRTFSVPLLFDDTTSVASNPTLRDLSSAFLPPAGTTVSGRPVLNLSLALNHAISGTHVWSYHALNLAIHVMAGLTLLGIVRRTLAPRLGQASMALALAASFLWSLHPLLTESVTYIIQRAESLMGLLYLLTLYAVIRGSACKGNGKNAWFILSVGACLLGMGTKEVMVSAPLVVLLYDRTFLAGTFSGALRQRRWLYAGLGATWIFLAFLVASTHGRGGTAGLESGVPWGSYALMQLPAVAHYLRLCFWPHPLAFDYGRVVAFSTAQTVTSGIVVGGLAAATIWALVRKPAVGFLGACFFAVLAPSSSVIPVATEAMAEHRMYLALIPVVVLFVAALWRWLGRGAVPVSMALAAVMSFSTAKRNEAYATEEGLWRDAVAARPENERAHSNLGDVLDSEGRTADAIAEREAALRLAPDSATVHNNMGKTLVRAPGRLKDAVAELEEALRLKPDFAEADNNLGNALDAEGRYSEAVARFEDAIRLKPDFAPAHGDLGNTLARIPGRMNDAIAQYEEALRLNPDYSMAHNNLGSALARTPGRMHEAVAQFAEAARLDPGYATAHYNLGNALKAEGRTADAIGEYEVAMHLRPDVASIHLGLAIALLDTAGRKDDAVAQLKETLRLQPGNAVALQILAKVVSGR